MHDHIMVSQRRSVGLILLASFLLFWGGAGFSIPLVDTKGASIYVLPPPQVLSVIAAHPFFWKWQSMLQLGGGIVAVLGLVLLTFLLRTVQQRGISLLGLVLFCLSVVFWVVIESFRLAAGTWAAQKITGTPPASYSLLYP